VATPTTFTPSPTARAGVAGIVQGGPGSNFLKFTACTSGVVVNLATGSATGTGGVATVQHGFGGSGADILTGDGGNNILLGNGGNDQLFGNDGRDFLFGGVGADVLNGGLGDDILFGGTTAHDNNPTAQLALLLEWSRTHLGYTARIDHLLSSTSGGLNGSFLLNKSALSDDNNIDTLSGGDGMDWFILGKMTRRRIRSRARPSRVCEQCPSSSPAGARAGGLVHLHVRALAGSIPHQSDIPARAPGGGSCAFRT
jgi:hypothetical protein